MSTQQEHNVTEIAPQLMNPWSVVVFKEGSYWLAIALEHAVIWWDETIEGAFTGLIEALYLQAEADLGYGQVPFSLAPRSPESFWDLFRSATKSTDLQMPSPLTGEVRVLA